MSQPTTMIEKTRSRVRAASLTGTLTASPPGAADNTLANDTSPATQQKVHKTKVKEKKKEATLEDVLKRLDGLEDISTALANLQRKYDEDRDRHEREMSNLIKLLDENRHARANDQRELMITKRLLDNTMEIKKRMQAQMNEIENRMKCCNLKIDGKPEEEGEDLRKYVSDVATAIGATAIGPNDLISAHRIGKRQENASNARQRPRPILIGFTNIQKRNKMYYARANLKNSTQHHGIYLNDDVTIITRKQREDYRSVAALARGDGAEVRVHSDGIVLDGKKYLLSEPNTLPGQYSLARAKMVELNGDLYFASEHAFLSNFHYSPIILQDTVYDTAEHLYQALKCEHAGDNHRLDRVLAATTPLEAKRVADALAESPEWRARKEEVMTRVVGLKFDQNPTLARLLLNTGDKPLKEATFNDYFGIGATLHGREVKDKSYRGANKLGNILMTKRASMRTEN